MMLNPTELRLAVGHVDVVEQISFHRSMRYWQSGEVDNGRLIKQSTALQIPLSLESKSDILIDGDCLADIEAKNGALIHVLGNLNANVTVSGHSEIVIAGDCSPSSTIWTDGICHIFTGSNFSGHIESKGSTLAWIHGTCDGRISTGTPTTKLYVMGDMTAIVSPTETAALLYLVVYGFAPTTVLKAISECGYTEFNASIGISDCPEGIYPEAATYDRFRKKRGYVRWTVHRQR